MRFWTADTHFGHENILRLGPGRPFRTINEHDSALVDRWNAVVGPDDEVMHLGDVAMKVSAMADVVPYLNGRITLVAGNHDQCWTESPSKRANRAVGVVARYLDAGFVEVIASGQTTAQIEGIDVVVSHLPAEGDPFTTERYLKQQPETYGRPLVCGHVHHLWRTYGRQVNVGVDHWGYAPVAEADLAEVLRGLPAR